MNTAPTKISEQVRHGRVLSTLRSRVRDYLELTKPRVNGVVMLVTGVGYTLGCAGEVSLWALVGCLFGTACLAAGASTLNQVLERRLDGLMFRTENRPLPTGRLRPGEALVLGLVLGVTGTFSLAATSNLLTTVLGLATYLSYVLVYTPMKRRTPHSLFVGAVPGALPPLIGWSAASGTLPLDAWVVFAILFVWQIPHFTAIAWFYRDDYRAAEYPMFAVLDRDGRASARMVVWSSLALVVTSFVPLLASGFSLAYCVGAALLGLAFLFVVFRFSVSIQNLETSRRFARRVVQVSIVYLPALFLLLLVD